MRIPASSSDKVSLIAPFQKRINILQTFFGLEKKKRVKAEKELEKLKTEHAKLRIENEQLKKEIANLRDCRKSYISMLFKGNPRNKRTTTDSEEAPRMKKRIGGQPGHAGVTRPPVPEELITSEVDCTLTACPTCALPYVGCKRRLDRVIEDIVIPEHVEVTRYWINAYECRGCGTTATAPSSEIIGNSPFGRKTFAAILFYRYRSALPLQKISEIMEELHGLTISPSGIQGLLKQAAAQFGEKYKQLKCLLEQGKILHADETRWRMHGENWWTWLWSAEDVTIFTTETTRGSGIPKKMLADFSGLLVRDGYDGYNRVLCDQQLCWVHLLRRAHVYCEREEASEEMSMLKDTLKAFYGDITTWHRQEHGREERIAYHRIKRTELLTLTQQQTEKDSITFVNEWIFQHRDRLVTFLKIPGAPSENNAAERAVRPRVIMRKISGGSRSPIGVKITDINTSIIETVRKQLIRSNTPHPSLLAALPVFGYSP